MNLKSLSRLLCVGCLMAVGLIAQDAPPPQPPPPPGQGPGGGGGGRGGNFDPARFQERMMARIQENLGVTADEWKVIQPRLTAVMDKDRALRELQGGRNMFGGRRGGPQPEPAAEIAAVEKAAAGNDAAAIKTALEALRKARTDRTAEVTKAKDALREVLSAAQEAKLVVMGLLD
jgi:hypothetical protein